MASKEAKRYEEKEYERYVSSGQEEDDLKFINNELLKKEKKLSFTKKYETRGEPGNCLLGIGTDIVTCKATSELCIIHKDDKWGKNRKKELECPFDKCEKIIFEYKKE